jgi:hypothetical protein
MLEQYLLRYPQFCVSLRLLHVRIVQILSAYSETILVIFKKIIFLRIIAKNEGKLNMHISVNNGPP